MTDWKAKAEEVFTHVGMMRAMGAEIVEVTENEAKMAFVVAQQHGNYMGGLHGGAVVALIDTVAFFPGCLLPTGRKLTTEGVETHFFRPAAMGERITGHATILRNGRRVVTVEVKVSKENGEQLAHGIVTMLDIG